MEIAPGPLLRTHTTPNHNRSLAQTRPGGPVPSRGQASLRPVYPSSTASLASSTTTVFSSSDGTNRKLLETMSTSEVGKVTASDSIINQVADSSKSLYQICVKLRHRLAEVPGFQRHLDEMEHAEAEDPVMAMWKCLKKGYPLLTVYNTLNPVAPIEIDPRRLPESKRAAAATFKFSEACKTHLKFPPEECFLIKDLHGDDTTGFVKVVAAVNRVLDILQSRNLLLPPEEGRSPTAPETSHKRTRRDYIVGELVDTERKYVQHLESLQQFKVAVEEKGEVPGDKVHTIFLNLNALLDFQRRFLIRIETVNSLPEKQQNWGQLFTQSQDSFRVYEPYIANQQHGEEQAMLEFDKLQNVGHQIAADRATLSGFLTKPFQRLSKYPLLLKELRDKCEAEENIKDDLLAGINAAIAILERVNAAVDKEQRLRIVQELAGQVDDWKGHNLDQFGELLLHGTFAVVKTDGRSDVEKDYRIYLFELILLCCKELSPSKKQNNIMSMNRAPANAKGKIKMQLKGRIFMQNVTETLSLQKPGSYTIQIFWKGDPGVENFVIRFTNEEVMKKWYMQVETQRKTLAGRRAISRSHHGSSTSDTEFAWVKHQGVPPQNPYRQSDDDGDDGSSESTVQSNGNQFPPRTESSMSRNPSDASSRLRPVTGENGPVMPPMGTRIAPARFPMGPLSLPQLSLHTQIASNGPSPAERVAATSYFSPTAESPASTRASSSSGMYPFPRQIPPLNHWSGEEQNRFTAPVMGRVSSREGPSTEIGGNSGNVRTNMRPSLPAMASQATPQAALAQNRMRSASSPDIHGRRLPNGEHAQPPIPDVPVPPFPTHVTYKPSMIINRSHTNSPVDMVTNAPKRSGTQSPSHQSRERPVQSSYTSNPLQQPQQHQQQQQQQQHPSPFDPRTHGSSPSVTPVPTVGGPTMPATTARYRLKSPPLATWPTRSSFVTTATTSPTDMISAPTQLKVKVSFESNYVTLVVATNISYQSLVDRIDAKLLRFTSSAIGRGTIRLRYRDEDGDNVTIRSDEDVLLAFTDWKEQQRSSILQGQLGEIQLFCQSIDG